MKPAKKNAAERNDAVVIKRSFKPFFKASFSVLGKRFILLEIYIISDKTAPIDPAKLKDFS